MTKFAFLVVSLFVIWSEIIADPVEFDIYTTRGYDFAEQPAYDEIPPCDYPDVDFLADRIVEHLKTVVPEKYMLADDNKGQVNAKNIVIYHLNTFERSLQSALACNEHGLSLTIPIKWQEPLMSDFEVAPGFTRRFYVPVSGSIKTMEADVVIDVVFGDESSAHVRSLKVTKLRDVKVGTRGDGWFARATRKLASGIANEFTGRITKLVEGNLQELLDDKMVQIPLKDLGFE